MSSWNRRQFLKNTAIAVAGWSVSRCAKEETAPPAKETPHGEAAGASFQISLAEWSLHRALKSGELDHLDFITNTHNVYGLHAVEYVNQFFKDRAKDTAYLTEMKTRADSEGVHSLLIMCDGEGLLGDPDEVARTTAVENHYKWVEAAKFLGCHSIRVNAASEGSWDEQKKLAADGLRRLAEFGDEHGINVIVENHGGLSSNGQWLSEVIQTVDHPRSGTLPDFGNFKISDTETYDNYKGVEELMPFAKAVSAKSYDFDEEGNETELDYPRLVKIVVDAGYSGYIGIEYEGSRLSEPEGIRATKALLQRLQ